MSEWREIWKKSIEIGQKALVDMDEFGILFESLRNTKDKNGLYSYKNDKMVDFEEGIVYEYLGYFDRAIKIYEKLSSKENGLPVEHWRKVANLFLGRTRQKKLGKRYSENFGENFKELDYSLKLSLYEIQWTAFYELHTFAFLPDHIRYLAISSMSRIDSEPAMAIVIFRTCLEGVLKILYPVEYKKMEDKEKTLGYLINNLFNNDKLFTKKSEDAKKEDDLCYIIKERGNDAAHGIEVDYSNQFLCETIIMFIEIMKNGNLIIYKNRKKMNKLS